MATSETEINTALAEVLGEMRPRWVATGEPLRAFAGNLKHPDILVTEPSVAPVVVENEVSPANTVEHDAADRLGETLVFDKSVVMAAIALRTSTRFREVSQAALRDQLRDANDLDYSLFTGENRQSAKRFPLSGWLTGSVSDLANLVHAAAVPASAIDAAAKRLEEGVTAAAGLLEQSIDASQDIGKAVFDALRQEDSLQTRRMAMTIVANAFVFHENLAGSFGISSVDELRNELGDLTKTAVLREWNRILDVNYWPIFDISRQIVKPLSQGYAAKIFKELTETAADLIVARVTRSHDLAGTVFQRLVADRKYLATFYTRPSAAALLATLAVPDADWWGDPDRVKAFVVADFACGTGTLLSAAYQRISQLHERAGGDSEAVHPQMIERALIGCDVMPSAVHLTASMLASTHPTVKFSGTRLFTLPYGPQPDKEYALGSLDLLSEDSEIQPLFRTSAPVRATGEGEREVRQRLDLPPASCDVVIMNPPFTRPTNHEGKHGDIPNPAFAAFGADPQEQKAMSDMAKSLGKGTCANGNAGVASHFVALADRMVRSDGAVALVLPLTVLQGDSWQKARDLWLEEYGEITVVTIAGARPLDKSFSADTGMGETLVIARKGQSRGKPARGLFVTLRRRPQSIMEASEIARSVNVAKSSNAVRRLEDGPYGGIPVYIGQEQVGEMLSCPIIKGEQWPVAGIADLSLAQAAHQLLAGRLWFPSLFENDAVDISITTVREIADRGFLDRDINGAAGRGAFDIMYPCPTAATYPSLWNRDSNRERAMIVEPDSEATVRRGKEERAAEIWATSSRAHHNRDMQFNANSLSVAFTGMPSVGGRAWPNVVFADQSHELVFTLWGNSTLGMLCYWWHSTKQQAGRGSITITALETLPTLDVRRLDRAQLDTAAQVFEDIKHQRMLPFNEATHDLVRQELDYRLLTEVLGIDPSILGAVDLLRRKLCDEPSVHGGKKSRAAM